MTVDPSPASSQQAPVDPQPTIEPSLETVDASPASSQQAPIDPHPTIEPSLETFITGRDSRGRFVDGNAGGPGNPYARQVAAFKRRMHELVSDEDFDAIIKYLIARARMGNFAFMKLFFEYFLGKPGKAVHPDHVDEHEWGILQRTARFLPELPEVSAPLHPRVALPAARIARWDMTREIETLVKNLPPREEGERSAVSPLVELALDGDRRLVSLLDVVVPKANGLLAQGGEGKSSSPVNTCPTPKPPKVRHKAREGTPKRDKSYN